MRENRIGADAQRQTGVATFDGHDKKKLRVTYKRILEHLESKYGRKFSYGAIIQLSVVRNNIPNFRLGFLVHNRRHLHSFYGRGTLK